MRKKALILVILLIPFFVFAQTDKGKGKEVHKIQCSESLFNTYICIPQKETCICLFHLYPQLYQLYFYDRVIYNEFLKRQKYITPDMQGVRVSYVLYRLRFFNCMVKVFSDAEFGDAWNGVMFYDYEKNRLLLIRFNKYYPSEKKDFYLKNIDDELCSAIEYFDLNKGIYEFASGDVLSPFGNIGEIYEIKKDKLEIKIEVLKGTFPGIDRNYCCKESILITDEIRAFLKYTEDYNKVLSGGRKTITTDFAEDLIKLDKKTYKEFEQFWKSPEGKKYKLLITSTQSTSIPYLYKLEQEQEKREQQKKKANAKEKKEKKQQKIE